MENNQEEPPVPEVKRRGRPKQYPDVRTYNREYYHKMCKKEIECPHCKKILNSISSLRRHNKVSKKCELARCYALLNQIRSSFASSAISPALATTPSPSRPASNTKASTTAARSGSESDQRASYTIV